MKTHLAHALWFSCFAASASAAQSPPQGAASAASPAPVPVGTVSSLLGVGPLFFNEDNTGVLWSLSPTNGASTNVGVSGVTSNTVGLAPRDGTTLFGTIWADVAIVQANGSGAAVLPNSIGAEGLAFDASSNTLYAAINGQFFTVDPSTGAQLAVLPSPPGDVEGLAFGNGSVYGLVGFGGNDTNLYRYSLAQSAWILVGDTTIDWNEVGLAYDPATDRLYAKGSQSTMLYRIHPVTAVATVVGDTGITSGGGLAWLGTGNIGTAYCTPGVANSTGVPGVFQATGSTSVAANDVTLLASSLPLQSFGVFLTSRTQGNVPQPGGSQGVLCLGGAIGRYVAPGQIQSSGSTGTIQLTLDLTRTPTPTGLVVIAAGETWNFQAWHRDAVGGVATSNFTTAVSINFQ